jgi:hypothetical protein
MIIELDTNTSLEEIKKQKSIFAYHSTGLHVFEPRENLHCGSLVQAVFRADYKINDEQLFDHAYIYKLHISLEGLLDDVILDDGYESNPNFEDVLKSKCNVALYKNVAEGYKKDKNLSLLVLNKRNIISYQNSSVWSGEEIETFLYGLC